MRVLAWIPLLVAASLAGCFGGDAGPEASQPDSDDGPMDSENGTVPGGNTTSPGPTGSPGSEGNETGGSGNVTWSYEERQGEVSGTALVATGDSTEEETFPIENGTVQLVLNITVEGDPLEVRIADGACTEEDCEQTVDVSSGEAMVTYDGPVDGPWRVSFASDTMAGPYSSSYTLEIGIASEAP